MLRGVLLRGKWRRLTSAIFGEPVAAAREDLYSPCPYKNKNKKTCNLGRGLI
jgi:hypothetical protein